MIQVIAGARSQGPWGPLSDERTPLEPFPAAAYRASNTCFGLRRSRCSGGGHVVRIPTSGSSIRFSNAEIRHRLSYRFLLVESASSCDEVSGPNEADFLHRLAARGALLTFNKDVPSGHKSASEASNKGILHPSHLQLSNCHSSCHSGVPSALCPGKIGPINTASNPACQEHFGPNLRSLRMPRLTPTVGRRSVAPTSGAARVQSPAPWQPA